MSAEAAKIKEKTIQNKTELSGAARESFGRKQANPVAEEPKDIKVPGLSNDNAHKDTPDWSVFSLNKFHPHLGLAQISLTALGLFAGLAFGSLIYLDCGWLKQVGARANSTAESNPRSAVRRICIAFATLREAFWSCRARMGATPGRRNDN